MNVEYQILEQLKEINLKLAKLIEIKESKKEDGVFKHTPIDELKKKPKR